MAVQQAAGSRIAVSGATGQVGGMVARLLAEQGVPQLLLARDPRRAPKLPGAGVAACDYGNADQARSALQGVEVLFLVSGRESADRLQHHRTMVDAARTAGVRHVVYTSYVEAAPDAVFTLARDHWATEQMLRGSGMAHTFLRDNMYLDFAPELVGDDGVIRGPAGAGRAAMVARRDVAAVAARILTDPGPYAGRTLDMTGPEALSLDDVAELLTRMTGRPVRYQEESVEQAYASRSRYGAPQWQLDAWVSTYTAMAAGQLAHVSDDVAAVTGRQPQSLEEFLTERHQTPPVV